jgi:hypothetical protein
MSGDCFSVLAILILHRFDLALHASRMMLIPYSMFLLLLLYIYIYIIGGENAGNFIFFSSWHVRYCLYFCLISQFIVH